MELFLEGQFDESGNDRCSIGTFKTLRDDAEACRLMGQLCGVLMYHTAKYVNETCTAIRQSGNWKRSCTENPP